MSMWRVGEVVTQESAKLPCAGSIPARASKFDIIVHYWVISSAVERFPDKKEAHGPTP